MVIFQHVSPLGIIRRVLTHQCNLFTLKNYETKCETCYVKTIFICIRMKYFLILCHMNDFVLNLVLKKRSGATRKMVWLAQAIILRSHA